jgi:hypothetical protein
MPRRSARAEDKRTHSEAAAAKLELVDPSLCQRKPVHRRRLSTPCLLFDPGGSNARISPDPAELARFNGTEQSAISYRRAKSDLREATRNDRLLCPISSTPREPQVAPSNSFDPP